MQDKDLWSELDKVFKSVFGRSTPAAHRGLLPRDVKGWDSFNHLNLLMAVESRWNVAFSEQELRSIENAGDIATLLRGKIGPAQA